MQLAILQKWPNEKTFTLMFQSAKDQEEQCKNILENLRQEAHRRKIPVEYQMIELDGSLVEPEPTKPGCHSKIIIPGGQYKGMEILIERDVREERV